MSSIGEPPEDPSAQRMMDIMDRRVEQLKTELAAAHDDVALLSGALDEAEAALDEQHTFLCYITEVDVAARNDDELLVCMGDKLRVALASLRAVLNPLEAAR